MSPGLQSHDPAGHRMIDSKLSADLLQRKARGVATADFTDHFFVQLPALVASLPDRIAHIVACAPKEEMQRIDARRRVAVVADVSL